MSAITASLKFNRQFDLLPSHGSKLWWIFVVMAIAIAMFFATVYVAASGFGGFLSEYLVSRSGVNNSNLLVGSSGATGSGLDIGMSGIAIAMPATNIYMDGAGTHATLNGSLTTLNGFPNVSVYFEWGYDASYGNSTAPQNMTATGSFSDNIAHYDPGKTIYYRTVVEADGKSYSSPANFVATGGIVTGFNLLNAIVVLAYIALILFVMVAIGQQSTIAALLWLAVAIYVGEAFIVAIQEALSNLF